MGRKNSGYSRPSRSNNPLDSIFDDALNVLFGHGLQRMSMDISKILGLGGVSPGEKLRLERSQLSLKKLEADIAHIKKREADALERTQQLKIKQQKQEALREKLSRLYDLRIQEKELDIERVRRNLDNIVAQKTELDIHYISEPISGALEVIANPSGLHGGPPEQKEAYKAWLDSFESGKVVLILGKRGSGKTALAAKIAEYMMAVHRMPTYWIGLPEQARELLPHWVKLVDSPDKCPVNSFIMCDEAGINYLSLLFNTSQNRFMRRLLMIARQRHISLAFAAQSSRDIDWSILRQADTTIFKEPGLHQPDSERTDIKSKAKKAALTFKEIPKEERVEAAYVFDDDFEGVIKFTLPSFWTEELSHIYAHLDLTQIEVQGKERGELSTTIEGESRNLDDTSLDKQILELRRQDYGIERIAKTLGCTIWRVRKCLNI